MSFNIKFNRNPSSGYGCEWTDRHEIICV